MKTLSTAAQAAKAIRAELKAAFPGVTFKVTSENYSMGNSVHINWTDGPTRDKVTDISSKYEYGHFNSMEDIYEYDKRDSDLPQVKYVLEQRDMSNEVMEKLVAQINKDWGWNLVARMSNWGRLTIDPASDFHTGSGWASHKVHQYFSERSF